MKGMMLHTVRFMHKFREAGNDAPPREIVPGPLRRGVVVTPLGDEITAGACRHGGEFAGGLLVHFGERDFPWIEKRPTSTNPEP